ncbi:MAG: IPT/TIG domain-containing protein [Acidobacteriia bacterium]|nr:IPT/TIG domain-containing protein [Terriglobia bacterium]
MRTEDCTQHRVFILSRLLIALFLLIILSSLGGCGFGAGQSQSDVTKGSSGITLTAIAPSSGPQTGGTTVNLTGTGFVAGMTVNIDTTAATSVTIQSTSSATAVTPAHATGVVAVQVSSQGTAASLPSAFTYTPAFSVTGISPNSGPVAGGATATVSGSAFQAGATVLFGGVPATVVNTTATQITVTTPPGPAGIVDVRVNNPDGQTQTLAGAYTYTAALTVSLVTPASGPSTGGNFVTINGVAFQNGASVLFGGTVAPFVSFISSTQLQATTPAHAIGAVNVQVTQGGQTATLANGYTYQGTMTILGLAPNSGGTGTLVTLNGTGFQNGAKVSFGGVAATQVNFVSSSQISAVAPNHAAGAVDVVVTNADGQVITLPAAFSYVPLTISSLQPNSGPVAGQTSVIINGTSFQPNATVTFGGVAALAVSVVTSNEITAVTPAGAAGAVDVVVKNPSGETATATAAFTYVPPVTINSPLVPANGVASGGTVVAITGSNFEPGVTVLFGGITAPVVVFNNPGSLTVTTPPHAASAVPVDVTVINPDGGTATLAGGYTYTPAVVVSSITPATGPGGGGTIVTITGAGFSNVPTLPTVFFGATQAVSVTFNSPTQLTATTPAGAGTVNVKVVNPDATSSTLASAFTYVAAPALNSVAPNTGPATGGTVVTLTGANFVSGALASFQGVAAATTFVSNTKLTAVTPPQNASTVDVQVTNPDGQNAILMGAFQYVVVKGGGGSNPTISNVSPSFGGTSGGDSVLISGANFNNGATVTFGGVAAPSVVVNSGAQIAASTPPGSVGAVDVTVTNTDATTGTLPAGYTYLGLSIISLNPNSASILGGTQVTITGTLFQNGTKITFGGIPATLVTFVNSTTLIAITPAHASGPVDVTATNPDSSTGTLPGGLIYGPPPTITNLTRQVGTTAGGTIFTINGTGFENGLTVKFGATQAPTAQVLTSTQIRVTTPPHAPGFVNVTVTNPDATNGTANNAFDFEPAETTFYFNNAFEAGVFDPLTAGHFSGSGLNTVISTDVAVSGTHSVKCEVDAGQASGISRLQYLWSHAGEPPNPGLANPNGFYQRWYLYFAPGSIGHVINGPNSAQMKLLLNRYDLCCGGLTHYPWFMVSLGLSAGGTPLNRMMALEDSGIDNGAANIATKIVLQEGVWYEIETHFVRDGVNHVGQATIWVNGQLQGQTPFLPGLGSDIPTAQESALYGAVYVQSQIGTVTVYVDDAAAADGFIEPTFYP